MRPYRAHDDLLPLSRHCHDHGCLYLNLAQALPSLLAPSAVASLLLSKISSKPIGDVKDGEEERETKRR